MAKKLLSTAEVAKILGISRVAVFQRIKKGQLRAIKVGRNYVIEPKDIGLTTNKLTKEQQQKIEEAVKRAFHEYGNALKDLGDA